MTATTASIEMTPGSHVLLFPRPVGLFPDLGSNSERGGLWLVRGGRGDAVAVRVTPDAAVFRRRRVVAAGLVVAALLAGLVLGEAMLSSFGGPPTLKLGPATFQPVVSRTWVVRPGDTLWSIALASGVRGDIRPLVDRLDAEVHDQPLQPGMQVAIP